MRILFGTGNEGKLRHMRKQLRSLPLEILGIGEVLSPLPDVDESGRDPLENAIAKANAYYAALGVPVFSCDSGLYIEGLPPQAQPGVHVRRVAGRSLSDEEMILHYADVARSLGGRCTARYRNGICLVLADGRRISSMEDALSGNPFYLTDTPHPRREPGFPLDSLSVHIASGRYFYDRPPSEDSLDMGFCAFFQRALGL